MEQFLYMILIAFGFIAIAFFMINIRQIFTGKEFHGTCGSQNAVLRNKIGECSICGSKVGEPCKKEE